MMRLKNVADEMANQLVRRPLAVIYGALGAIATIWAVIDVAQKLEPRLQPQWRLPLLLGVILFIVLPLVGWCVTSYRWRYGLSLATNFIFSHLEKCWEIDETGNARITTTTTYFFLRDPDKKDLTDSAFGSAPISLKQLEYHSPDAKVRDYRAVSRHRHIVYWQPKNGDISPGVAYEHKVISKYPYHGQRPSFKSLTIAPQALTLTCRVIISSQLPIEEIIAYKGFRFQRNRNAQAIAKRARTTVHTRAALARRVSSAAGEWEMTGLEPGATYYLVIFFAANQPAPPKQEPAAIA